MRYKACLTGLLLTSLPLCHGLTGGTLLACRSAVVSTKGRPVIQVVVDSTAERMLLYQRTNGGWPQPGGNAINYSRALTDSQQKKLLADKGKFDTTIDDKATTHEINYLVEAYGSTKNEAYRQAAERGIAYLLTAQNGQGGWGQFYPDSSAYRAQITYNDNAMIDVLKVMQRTADRTDSFALLDPALAPKARQAMNRGVDCILNTQYKQQGKLTAWCAQHDRHTLQPANARAFELASLSGSESVGITEFLMSLPNPTDRIKQSVQAAVTWLDGVKLTGVATKTVPDASQPSGRDVVVVQDPGAVRWARFYDLASNKPFFCGRDGIKKYSLDQIENERRVGYGWYGTWPAKLIATDYPAWQKKWVK